MRCKKYKQDDAWELLCEVSHTLIGQPGRELLVSASVCQFRFMIKLGRSISYQFSNDVEFKLAILQLIDTIKRTIFKKVRKETILKIHNTLVLLTYLYGSENWTLNSLTKTKN